jgi:hypothetical protein
MRRSGRARGDRCDPTGGLAPAPRAPSRGLGAEGWRSPQAQTHVGPGRLTGAPRQGWCRAPPSAGFGKRIRLFEENPLVDLGGIQQADLPAGAQMGDHVRSGGQPDPALDGAAALGQQRAHLSDRPGDRRAGHPEPAGQDVMGDPVARVHQGGQ